jgi:hypothetical protein
MPGRTAALRPRGGGRRFQAPAAALLLRAAAEGGAQFTELLAHTQAEEGVGAILSF